VLFEVPRVQLECVLNSNGVNLEVTNGGGSREHINVLVLLNITKCTYQDR